MEIPDFKGTSEDYCVHYTDVKENLKKTEEVKFRIAEWFKTWQPDLDQEKAFVQAENYMKTMPTFAD